MAKLIGTDPNQVPTNGDLGDLAYQSKDNLSNLNVGSSDTNPSGNNVQGIALGADGQIDASRNGASLDLNRISTDGAIANFRKDGATVGSIGCRSSGGNFQIYSASAYNSGIDFGADGVYPMAGSSLTDNSKDLGTSTVRWKNLYLSGGVYLGGTGSANYLDDYEEGTWTPTFTSSGSSCDATVTTIEGKYTKVGRLVTCHIRWQLSNKGTATAHAGISLPFTVADVMTTTAVQGQASVGWTSSSGTTLLFAAPWEGTTDVRFGKASSHNDTATYALNVDEVGNGFDGRMTVTYMTS